MNCFGTLRAPATGLEVTAGRTGSPMDCHGTVPALRVRGEGFRPFLITSKREALNLATELLEQAGHLPEDRQ